MKAGWKRVEILSQLAEIQTGPFGSQLHENDYVLDGGTPIVTVEHLGKRRFTLQNLPLVSDADKQRLSRYTLSTGDIVFSRVGAVDRCSYVSEFENGWMFSGRCIRVRPKPELDSLYLYYFFCDEKTKRFVRDIAVGSTMPSINTALMGKVPIILPPLPTQRRIAAVLGALDDAIELNRKMNANLEAQAQALFKSWFVDFAPWGGKMPKGWKMGTLGEVCSKLTDGSHFSPKDDASSNIPMLSVKDMGSDDFDYSKCKHISEADFKGMSANGCVPLIDDILVAKDGSYLKSIFIVNESKRQAVLSSIAIFRPNQRVVRPEYLLNLLRQPLILEDVKRNYVSGTGVPRIVLKDFRRYPVVVPPLEVQDKINGALHEIRLMIAMNIEESRKLAETRDALLPKLMSGEVEA